MTFSPIVKRYVYLIKKNNLVNGKMSIKIGFSKEPQRRLKELQTCNDSKLSILTTFHVGYTVADALKAERQVLKMSSNYRTQVKNEWVQIDPICLMNVLLPQINAYVKTLNVGNDPLPVSSIGSAKIAKKMYMALKIREINLKKRATLTLGEEFEAAVIKTALEKEKSLEMKIQKAKHEAKVAKEKARKEKRAKEQRAFHYLCYGMR